MKAQEFVIEYKKNRKAPKFNIKPRTGHAPTQTGAGEHKDKKKAEKQGDYKHKKDKMPMEAGYQHGFGDPNAPGLGAQDKRDFKRAELQHELGHETNNIAVHINGKLWKVFAGKGYADSPEEYRHLQSMKNWAAKKSAATGKKWEVYLTGANPTA